ncbi:unnamed protein product [Ascophyllum nodosum]
MSCRLITSKRQTWKRSAVHEALGAVVAVTFLFLSGLVVRASDVFVVEQRVDPQHHHRWSDDWETTIPSEEAGVEQQSGSSARLHRRADEGPTADFQSSGKKDTWSTVSNVGDGHGPGDADADRLKSAETTTDAGSMDFLEVARQRFVERNGRVPTAAEEQWTFNHLQLVRVPKAGSSEASMVARRLAGCNPKGPCCKFPGDPPGSCPERGLMCNKVTGCAAHNMDSFKKRELLSPGVFSMANVRDVADRIVSGFFYTSPHSPECARESVVDYESCFQEMIDSPRFQNVASKMLCGRNAYDDSTRMCSKRDVPSSLPAFDSFPADSCREDMTAVIGSACHLNFVTICETWGSSLLLLFETLPWLGPTDDFFPAVGKGPLKGVGDGEHRGATEGEHQEPQHSRQNPKKEEGMKYITPKMMELARRTNDADVELYEFVTAKFCGRLRDTGLLEKPIVQDELSRRDQLEERCNNASWVASTLERFEPFTPVQCRLFEPLARPQDL